MFSQSNHHQRCQKNSSPRESLRARPLKTSQPSTRNNPANVTANMDPIQHEKPPHKKLEAKVTSRTTWPLSPPQMLGPGAPRPFNAHLHTIGVSTVAEDVCMLESLLKSALAALVIIQSTSNPTHTLSQTVKHTLAEINKLVSAKAPGTRNNANDPIFLNSQGVQT